MASVLQSSEPSAVQEPNSSNGVARVSHLGSPVAASSRMIASEFSPMVGNLYEPTVLTKTSSPPLPIAGVAVTPAPYAVTHSPAPGQSAGVLQLTVASVRQTL